MFITMETRRHRAEQEAVTAAQIELSKSRIAFMHNDIPKYRDAVTKAAALYRRANQPHYARHWQKRADWAAGIAPREKYPVSDD